MSHDKPLKDHSLCAPFSVD